METLNSWQDGLLNTKLSEVCQMNLLGSFWSDGIQKRTEIGHQIYAQQLEMIEQKTRSVKDRIVSFNQPQTRPIVRDKEKTDPVFGPKRHHSWVRGFAFTDKRTFNVFSEKKEHKSSRIKHQERFRCFP